MPKSNWNILMILVGTRMLLLYIKYGFGFILWKLSISTSPVCFKARKFNHCTFRLVSSFRLI